VVEGCRFCLLFNNVQKWRVGRDNVAGQEDCSPRTRG
jgi:hypothetical protein